MTFQISLKIQFQNAIKPLKQIAKGFAIACRKLYLSPAGCRKPKKVRKQCTPAQRVSWLYNHVVARFGLSLGSHLLEEDGIPSIIPRLNLVSMIFRHRIHQQCEDPNVFLKNKK